MNCSFFIPDFLQSEKISSAKVTDTIVKGLHNNQIACLNLNLLKKSLADCQELGSKHQDKKFIIQVGLGGSSLGAECLIETFGAKIGGGKKFYFLNNIDPELLKLTLREISFEQSVFYIVSKSGKTLETLGILLSLMKYFKSLNISESKFKDHFVFACSSQSSDLFCIAQKYQIPILDLPDSIGGRFSIFTAVGLFPAILAGLNAKQLLDGVQSFNHQVLEQKSEHIVFYLAQTLLNLYFKGITQTVIMPYTSNLKKFGLWFAQLWAESLGKKLNLKSHPTIANFGLTPIAALGTSDQHSLLQLFLEGPLDKFIFFISCQKFSCDFDFSNDLNMETCKLLAPHSLASLMGFELAQVKNTLTQFARPLAHLEFEQMDLKNFGYLISFFELLTIALADLAEINPFNQPSVEYKKDMTLKFLQSKLTLGS